MAPSMKKAAKPAAAPTACSRAIAHGELADRFVQDLIGALDTDDAGPRSVRAEFAARLAVMLSKNDEK
jgi:hypothetical protein